MKTLYYKRLQLIISAVLICFSLSKNSHALIPVIDAGTIAQSIENNLNLALELKSVKNVVQLAGKMSTTLGEALSTFNEYVTTYYKYKKQVDKALATADKVTGAIDAVAGTNLNDAVHDVQNASDTVGGVADTLIDVGTDIAGIADDVKKGLNTGVGGYNDLKDSLGAKKQEQESLERELAALRADYTDIENEIEELELQLEEQKSLQQNTTEIESEIRARTKTLNELETKIADLEVKLNQRKAEASNDSSGGDSSAESSAAADSPTGGAGLTASLTGSGTNGGFAILPNELADYCGIKAADITELEDKPKVVECLKKLITYRNSKDKDSQRDARDIYVRAFHETAYANVAEAVVMRNYAVNYEQQVLEPLTESLKNAKTIRDDYSGVIMVNKEVANLLNKLIMIHSSKVAYDALRDYGDFEIYAEDVLNIGDSGK